MNKRVVVTLCLLLGGLASQSLYADAYCFTLADNYYEQVYCELQAKGEAQQLPSFWQFKQNEPMTQALLLKRPASKLGIKIKLPRKVELPRASKTVAVNERFSNTTLAGCAQQQASIVCGSNTFSFIANKSNKQLNPQALDEANKMDLPAPPALISPNTTESYLKNAYGVYLNKMMEIGLAGSTMHFNKFSYFYYDIVGQGVSFNGRFETLFHYLKKDKRQLAISKILLPESPLDLSACFKASMKIISCVANNKNYLFASDNG